MHSPCFVFLVHFALWLPFYTFCRASRPATRRPLLKKGSIRKLFLRTDNILFMEGRRIRNAGTVDFREPIYGHRAPLLPGHFSQVFPPCNPATPFSKGVDSKTFSVDGQHTFYGRVKNPECRNNGFPGTDLWIPCAVPSVGVLCSRAWWEASSESPWVFDDASRLHDLKRPSLFRRDEVLSRNAHRPFGFAFTHREKFLRVPRGVFSKTLLGREWDRVPQWSVRLFFYFLDCTDSFVYNLVPSTLKRKSFFRSFTGLLFRTFCFPSRRAFGSSVA